MQSFRVCLILLIWVPVTLVAMPVQWLANSLKLPLRRHLPRWWHRNLTRLMGIRIIETGSPTTARPLLITANHASWLDIVVISSLLPVSFISKAEISRWPLFGTFARLQRTVFVDRASRAKTGKVNDEIGDRLKSGDAMVLFAEGTASDGNRVLPFRTALLGAAQKAIAMSGDEAVCLQPLAVAYTRMHGIPLGRHFRPRAAWYGGMNIVSHLKGVFFRGAIDVEVTWGEPIFISPNTDRKNAAVQAEKMTRKLVISALSGLS